MKIIPENYALTFDDIQIIPNYSNIDSRKECDTTTSLVDGMNIKIPIISAPMDTVTEFEMMNELNRLGAVGGLHRFMPFDKLEKQIQNMHFGVVSIGSKFNYNEFKKIYDYGVRIYLIDVAHGHSGHVERTIKSTKDHFPDIKIMAGSIATYTGAKDLIEWGADSLRVGIGNGALCETRIRTGVGIPQVTAILSVSNAIQKYNPKITLIADGGIRTPGDVAKAIGLGADMVMLGSLLAGTKESPGKLERVGLFPDEKLFKLYRGSASQSSKVDRKEGDNNIEGNSKHIPYKGKVERIINSITDGLRSAMSYVGEKDLTSYRKNIKFVRVTNAGQIEAQPHLLYKG